MCGKNRTEPKMACGEDNNMSYKLIFIIKIPPYKL